MSCVDLNVWLYALVCLPQPVVVEIVRRFASVTLVMSRVMASVCWFLTVAAYTMSSITLLAISTLGTAAKSVIVCNTHPK